MHNFEEIIKNSDKFVYYVIHKTITNLDNVNLDYEDLHQIGTMAIYKAAETYEDNANVNASI